MARKLKISASELNIRLHPHSEEIYGKFIDAIYGLKKAVKIHGDRFAIISSVNKSRIEHGFVEGIITTFTNIDASGEWFDASGLKAATDNQIEQIHIPENLHPNSASFYFSFDLRNHRMKVQTYSKGKYLNAKQYFTLLSILSRDLGVLKKFNEAKITIVQSKKGLEAMWKIKRIKEIQILICRPNSDILSDDFEDQIEKHLEETNAKSMSLVYKAEGNGSIKPDKDIKSAANVALENGEVNVRGSDGKGGLKLSTKDNPAILQDKYDPDEVSEKEAFTRLQRGQ